MHESKRTKIDLFKNVGLIKKINVILTRFEISYRFCMWIVGNIRIFRINSINFCYARKINFFLMNLVNNLMNNLY